MLPKKGRKSEINSASSPTRHSSRRSPSRRVFGGRPGVRISVRHVMLRALRFGTTHGIFIECPLEALEGKRVVGAYRHWNRDALADDAQRDALHVGVAAARQELEAQGRVRREACLCSKRSMPLTILRYDFSTGSRSARDSTGGKVRADASCCLCGSAVCMFFGEQDDREYVAATQTTDAR